MIASGKLTRAKLERFVKLRSEALSHNNLQFGLDAYEAGFNLSELGPVLEQPVPPIGGRYRRVWQTPYGDLIEEPEFTYRIQGD